VFVAVEHEFGAVRLEHVEERWSVDEPFVMPLRAGDRRMMDQHDPERTLAAQVLGEFAKRASCSAPSRPVAEMAAPAPRS